MSSSSYFFTTLNALPIIMVATEKEHKASYYFAKENLVLSSDATR